MYKSLSRCKRALKSFLLRQLVYLGAPAVAALNRIISLNEYALGGLRKEAAQLTLIVIKQLLSAVGRITGSIVK